MLSYCDTLTRIILVCIYEEHAYQTRQSHIIFCIQRREDWADEICVSSTARNFRKPFLQSHQRDLSHQHTGSKNLDLQRHSLFQGCYSTNYANSDIRKSKRAEYKPVVAGADAAVDPNDNPALVAPLFPNRLALEAKDVVAGVLELVVNPAHLSISLICHSIVSIDWAVVRVLLQ